MKTETKIRLYPYQWLRLALTSFILGVFIATLWSISFNLLVGVLGGSIIAVGVMSIAYQFYTRGWIKILVVISVGTFFLFFGMMRFSVIRVQSGDHHIVSRIGMQQSFKGTIVAEPERLLDKQRLVIRVHGLNGLLLATTRLYPYYEYHDELSFECIVQKPQAFDSFDYEKYLRAKNIDAVCYYPDISQRVFAPKNIFSYLFAFKHTLLEAINRALPEPHASLLAGMLVGAKKGLPDDVMEQFNRVGLTHIIAISGYNITIVIRFVLILAPWIWINRRHALWMMIPCIGLFVILVGGQASVVRAALFGAIGALAYSIGRAQSMTNALLLTAGLMVAINPWILRYDVGFQLSFLATAGLIYISPLFESHGHGWIHSMKEVVVATFSATIATLPLVLFVFGRLSVVSIIANFFVVPLTPFVMAVGGLVTAVAVCIPLNVQSFAYIAFPAWILLEYILRSIEFFSSWRYASMSIEWFSWPWMMISYVLLCWGVYALSMRKRRNRRFGMMQDIQSIKVSA
ncbi:MAG: ComEC/Rec2-related protein [Parcubacteria group bacterium GW2011_GWA2_43_13]|nr:MAG: ComEC/Rec2-related protein [Parcubacteria group bacterium GW2011_GWA2_43_13]OGY68807.1 MAG: hypothetical protein A3B94_01620 [Candidatus Jacksonbacteria bacterium RIFCSPHIGHO2_02_FULL_43_10]OGY70523.1 MAG: hypothetical protein A2986_02255 [Candidatus Jacksonbacteria bacterium RIFCSPLOWO2_01_FULL_44_13]HAZ16289.1 hypothetical protein [Candidatus Jacksonbacteria bacterium]